ncbi:MAG: DUF2007 domain-containing protein [Acidobacteriota bacterium]|nr:DUF2007 domain-containing protein [Acidobacteriota bacterium]
MKNVIMDAHDDNSEMVTVGKFLDPAEAQMAQGALSAAGIESFLQGENANNLYPMALRTGLLVSRKDEADARTLLESADATGPEEDDAA